MRIDKFLKLSKLVKRRSLAQEMINLGAVRLNRRQVKPSGSVKNGDLVEIAYTARVLSIKVSVSDENILRKKKDIIPYEFVAEEKVNPEERPW
jgi:ribosomal 50S subunit-recycling heat shock protein